MTSPPHTDSLDLPAGIAAALCPGLGHVVRGHLARGLLAAAGVLGLFFGGMLVGGIDVVDSREDRIWFIGQALVGPIAFGIDRLHQTRFKAWGPDPYSASAQRSVHRSGTPGEVRAYNVAQNRWEWRRANPQELAAGAGPPNVKSVGKVGEIGTLAATLAGMLNFIIFLDALLPGSRRPPARAGGEHPGG